MRIFKQKSTDELCIKPEGFVDTIVFERGHIACGQAFYGIGISIDGKAGGGVMTLDDLVELRDFINGHLENVANNK